jgi:hypothetical protein
MKFKTFQRVRRAALTAGVLVPVAALSAVLLPANATDGKLKQPGVVQASWSASTSGVTTRPYRTVWSPTQGGRNMPASYHGAVIIQRLSGDGWRSGMMLTPAGARDLAVRILRALHGWSGSVQIWNHQDGHLNATQMHFTAHDAYNLAYHLLVSAGAH